MSKSRKTRNKAGQKPAANHNHSTKPNDAQTPEVSPETEAVMTAAPDASVTESVASENVVKENTPEAVSTEAVSEKTDPVEAAPVPNNAPDKAQAWKDKAAELSEKARTAGKTAWEKSCVFSREAWSKSRVLGKEAWEKGRVLGQKGCAAAAKAWKSARDAGEAAWAKSSDMTAGGWDAVAKVRKKIARHPVSPLLYLTLLSIMIGITSFHGMYTRAYVLNVNGEDVGIVANEEELDEIRGNLESRVSGILGEAYDYDAQVSLTPVYTTPEALSDTAEVEDTLFDGVGALMEAYAISVDGEELGYAATKDELYQMLDEIAQDYLTEDAVHYEFMEDVQIYPVELPSNSEFNLESIYNTLTNLEVEEAVYVVEKGDTFNAIAYSLDMMPNELSLLNPDVMVDKLWVGQELVIQQAVPYLSVQVVTDETYEEVIESPVEYVETADLYVGTTKVKEQGHDGLALVNAQVTYINGAEVEREIIASTTLEEATTTYIYTGTTPRPVTASTGSYIWPVRGSITSRFGYRTLYGRGDYHLGLDIACPYGTTVKAADGGTVIKSGWSGSYGKLVAIRHDNGVVTYYAHNSSLLVSVGQKVYQGQAIARVGMTGSATGYHCHFEVRINGTSVNPLNYLR